MLRFWPIAALSLAVQFPACAQSINANLCGQSPKNGNVELLSSRPTAELVRYLEGLKSGKYAIVWDLNGFQAASQLHFAKRFSAAYGELVEEGTLRMEQKGTVNIQEMIDYLSRIVADEETVDELTLRREQHFPSIVYLRALQVGDCSFPYVLKDTPTANAVLSQVRQAYPDLNLESSITVFARAYEQAVASARERIKQYGSVSIYRAIEDLRGAITK